jgi:hypothetical protein
MTTILERATNMYNPQYDVITDLNTIKDLNNKLFCTFTDPKNLDVLIEDIKAKYSIIYNKMFVLEIIGKEEYVITYNVEHANVSYIPENTILVHRKKESNTLYTINALNALIRQLNNGMLDTRFIVNWSDYKNCILLNNGPELRRLDTAIYKIIDLNK